MSIDRHPKAPHTAVPSEAVPLPTGADHRLFDVEHRSESHPKAPHAAVPSEAVPLPTGVDHTMIDMISTIDVRKMTSRRLIVNLIFPTKFKCRHNRSRLD